MDTFLRIQEQQPNSRSKDSWRERGGALLIKILRRGDVFEVMLSSRRSCDGFLGSPWKIL